jgi:hypothetical protein
MIPAVCGRRILSCIALGKEFIAPVGERARKHSSPKRNGNAERKKKWADFERLSVIMIRYPVSVSPSKYGVIGIAPER